MPRALRCARVPHAVGGAAGAETARTRPSTSRRACRRLPFPPSSPLPGLAAGRPGWCPRSSRRTGRCGTETAREPARGEVAGEGGGPTGGVSARACRPEAVSGPGAYGGSGPYGGPARRPPAQVASSGAARRDPAGTTVWRVAYSAYSGPARTTAPAQSEDPAPREGIRPVRRPGAYGVYGAYVGYGDSGTRGRAGPRGGSGASSGSGAWDGSGAFGAPAPIDASRPGSPSGPFGGAGRRASERSRRTADGTRGRRSTSETAHRPCRDPEGRRPRGVRVRRRGHLRPLRTGVPAVRPGLSPGRAGPGSPTRSCPWAR